MNKFDTKTEKIKKHLLSGKTITSWEAIHLYEATRLAAIKKYLEKRDNIVIDGEMVYDNGSRYKVYWLKADQTIKEDIKNYLLRGNRITKEVAEQVFGCDHLNVVIKELTQEGISIVETTRHPLCGKPFIEYYIK